MQLEYAQNYYSNKSTISQNQLSNNQALDSDYYNRYQTEYQNIQNEKAAAEAIRQWEAEMAEQQRQYNENLAWQKEQARIAQEQWEKEYALSQQQLAISRAKNSSTNYSSLVDSLVDGASNANTAQKYESTYTPTFASKGINVEKAKWFTETFGADSLTLDEINQKIAEGISSGKISESDADTIYKAYGVKY